MGLTTLEYEACPEVWLIHLVTLHWKKKCFSFSQLVRSGKNTSWLGVGFSDENNPDLKYRFSLVTSLYK